MERSIWRLKTQFFISALVVIGGFLFFSSTSLAADPQIFITWRAKTYTPSFYSGKALPTTNSAITASLLLIDNGTVVDLSGQTVYWYLNDNLIQGTIGGAQVTFRVPGIAPNTLSLRVKLPDYAGGIFGSTGIPVVRPVAVISAATPQFHVTNLSTHLDGYPFFFNILKSSSLNFSWLANGKAPSTSEDPEGLTINFSGDAKAGSKANISLDITNPLGKLETAGTAATFILGK